MGEWGKPLHRTIQGNTDIERWTKGYRFRDISTKQEIFIYESDFDMMMELFNE